MRQLEKLNVMRFEIKKTRELLEKKEQMKEGTLAEVKDASSARNSKEIPVDGEKKATVEIKPVSALATEVAIDKRR